jgi:uncharacterized membrane protein
MVFINKLKKNKGILPAEPLGDGTTEFTFKLDRIITMFSAIFYWNFTAICANKFRWFKLPFILLHSLVTALESPKIRFFAFIT